MRAGTKERLRMPYRAAVPASSRKRSRARAASHPASRPARPPETTRRPEGTRPPETARAHDAAARATTRPPCASFAELPLPGQLLTALAECGVHDPFPIQAATLPDALAGCDILGRARTGSGKTLAFGLALLARTAGQVAAPGRPRALVLVPTRELAQQVSDALTPYGKALGLRLATVVGGVSMPRQIQALRHGAEVLVATPGRLNDLIQRGSCRLDDVAITVIDEADQMADMGFLPQITLLLDRVQAGGQRMLFSATLDGEVDRLVRRYLVDPVAHSVDPPVATITTMSHHLMHLNAEHKRAVTAQIAARDGQVLMFVRTKHGADQVAKSLTRVGVRAAALHGGKTQASRTRALDRFRGGDLAALVATDVAARGIHIDGVDLVVNVDPPAESKDYLHRGGRTARAGQSGKVVTLVLPEQRRDVTRLVNAAGVAPESLHVAPGHAELVRVTGARQPSGIPIADAPERFQAPGANNKGRPPLSRPSRPSRPRARRPGRSPAR